ncbi:MAG: hypothetical protein Q8R79_01850 [Legionellaceae bacterium]|nr:hypothetical protein [Legionellaceae bacterium]
MLLADMVAGALRGDKDAWNAWFDLETITDEEAKYIQSQCKSMQQAGDDTGYYWLLSANVLDMQALHSEWPMSLMIKSHIIQGYDNAVKQNNVLAMIFRAQMYEQGHGEPKNTPNISAAKALYERALALGDWWDLATYGLGMLYMQGKGCDDNKPDYYQASNFFYRGIEHGHLECSLRYAEFLEQGHINPGSVRKTKVESYTSEPKMSGDEYDVCCEAKEHYKCNEEYSEWVKEKQQAYMRRNPHLFFADVSAPASANPVAQASNVVEISDVTVEVDEEENVFSPVLGAGYFSP